MFLFDSLGWFGFWMSDWEWLMRGKIIFVTVRCMEFSCFLHTCSRMSQSKNKKEVERVEKEKSLGSAAVQEVPSLCLITFGSESTLKSMCITILIYTKKNFTISIIEVVSCNWY